MSQHHTRRVANIAGLVVNHLIAGVEHRAQSQIQSLADADSHQDLRLRIVANTEVLLDVVRDALAQFQQTQVGSVLGPATFEGVNCRLANVPRRGEIRFPDPQRNHARGVLDELKEVTDAGARDPRDVVGDEVAMNGGHGRLWGGTRTRRPSGRRISRIRRRFARLAFSGGSGGEARQPWRKRLRRRMELGCRTS